jgi:hypothetical protein
MVINHAEDKNNCAERGQFGVTEGNICKWQQMKEKLRNVILSQKAFIGPNTEHC